jgi:phosphatidylserine decarboxylase
MTNIVYIDRRTGRKETEKVYEEKALRLLYGDGWLSRLFSPWLLPLSTQWPFFSRLYGAMQKQPRSRRKIRPFIKQFGVDTSEFLDPVSSYRSFNDFFIRRLNPSARPIAQEVDTAIIPADGRYYFYSDIDQCAEFIVKGQKFKLEDLLGDASLAREYQGGSMVLARLCPSDYHRFHFPCDCLPEPTRLINGRLYSVNPLAIKKNIHIFTQNKRTLCELHTTHFGRILYMEIGATCVGSIHETYLPSQWHSKGSEKGYFEFGGSSLILLFARNTIAFDADLAAATQSGIEIRCLLGQSMGKSKIRNE